MQRGGVVDEDVEAPAILPDGVEHLRHLLVVSVIAGERDAFAAELVDFNGRRVHGAGQGRIAFALRAPGHVDRRACRGEREGDTFAGAA